MKKMPYKIKQKIRQYANAQMKVKQLSNELNKMFEEYGVDEDVLTANACNGRYSFDSKVIQTEALAFIHNCECDDLENTILDIERVFVYYANQALLDD